MSRPAGRGRRALAAAALALLVACADADDPATRGATHVYSADAPHCTTQPSAPETGDATLETEHALAVLVRVPRNYRADVAHPLLVVYAAAGQTPTASERLTGFTPAATAAGYVVAYARHIRPSRAALAKLARVPDTVAAHYCIDRTRVVMSGHSDGGTTSTALALLPASREQVAAIAPSAAGFTAADLAELGCPATPRPVRVWHGAADRLFPGYGREAAGWWAQCNGCDLHAAPTVDDGCERYAGCRQPVHYCEGNYGHVTWPPQGAARTVAFFDSVLGRP